MAAKDKDKAFVDAFLFSLYSRFSGGRSLTFIPAEGLTGLLAQVGLIVQEYEDEYVVVDSVDSTIVAHLSPATIHEGCVVRSAEPASVAFEALRMIGDIL